MQGINGNEQLSFKLGIEPTVINIKTSPKQIYKDTLKIKDEIILRTGIFDSYNNTDLNLTDIESLLLVRYENKEITFEQLKDTIKRYKLNIPFVNNEEKFKIIFRILDPGNSYSHYDVNKSESYYDILCSRELSYENIVDTVWAYKGYSQSEIKKARNIAKNHTISYKNITFSIGYDESYGYVCIYRDKHLLGHYDVLSNFRDNVVKLFQHENIDKSYLKFIDELMGKLHAEKKEEIKKQFYELKIKAKYVYEKDDECYMLFEPIYLNKGDVLRSFKDYGMIHQYCFDENHTMGTLEFENDMAYDIPLKCILKELSEKQPEIKLKYINEMMHDLDMFAFKFGKAKKAKEKEQYENYRKFYSGFNQSNSLNDKHTYSNDEKEKLKQIYKVLAMKFHPDVNNGDGEMMKFINSLKEGWGI